MRVAIIHYWLVAQRGGEKVLRAICDLYPQAVIFTHAADKDVVASTFPQHEVRTTFVGKLPFATRLYKAYLPLMPLALEEIDLSGFDLVISSESGPAKGVLPSPDAAHVCYCHTPMRYAWDQYHEYRNGAGPVGKILIPPLMHGIRSWDAASATRVDSFAANSSFIASRIRRYYGRSSTVIYPPVDVDAFSAQLDAPANPEFEDAYLYVGQLTRYKRPDLAVEACRRMGKKLVVIGRGDMEKELKAKAGPKTRFLGRADDGVLKDAFRSGSALLFPGQEDFGIVPVEAMAAGLPVIAANKGGALETVDDGVSGVHHPIENVDDLCAAIERFDSLQPTFNARDISARTKRFAPAVFKRRFSELVNAALRDSATGRRGSMPAPTTAGGDNRERDAHPLAVA